MTRSSEEVDQPITVEQVAKPIEVEQVAKPIEAQPVAKPIEAQPVAKPIEAQPVAKPIEAQPVAKPIEAEEVQPVDHVQEPIDVPKTPKQSKVTTTTTKRKKKSFAPIQSVTITPQVANIMASIQQPMVQLQSMMSADSTANGEAPEPEPEFHSMSLTR
jgi:hypothetical protein